MGSQRVEDNRHLNNNSVSLAYQLEENPGLLDQQQQKKILFSPAPPKDLKYGALRTAGSYAETDMWQTRDQNIKRLEGLEGLTLGLVTGQNEHSKEFFNWEYIYNWIPLLFTWN